MQWPPIPDPRPLHLSACPALEAPSPHHVPCHFLPVFSLSQDHVHPSPRLDARGSAHLGHLVPEALEEGILFLLWHPDRGEGPCLASGPFAVGRTPVHG